MKRVLMPIALLVVAFSWAGGMSAQERRHNPLVDETWVRVGGPIGGLGYDIRMAPRDPDILYVTDAWSGVNKSIDGGQTWVPLNKGIDLRTGPSGDAIPVFSLTIDPNNPDTIWIGLQDLGGVYRSDDGGQTWVRRNGGIVEEFGLTIRGIAIEPGDSNVVYIAGEVSSWQWAGRDMPGRMFDKVKGVVYKSMDGGMNWRAIWRGDNLARYVLIDPHNVRTLYVSTGIFDREAANSDVETNEPGGVGVLKSVDGGESWEVLNGAHGLTGLYVGSLFLHPENPDVLLAGSGHDYWTAPWDQDGQLLSPAGVYLSDDGGETWKKTLDSSIAITSVELCIGNPEVAYAAGYDSVHRSEDGGSSWMRVSPTEEHGKRGINWGPPGEVSGFPIDMQCDPRDPMRLFINNYGGGNFLTTDGGGSWTSSSQGYTGAQMRSIAVDPLNPARVYAGGRSGLFRSNNGGGTWAGLAYPPARFGEITTFEINPVDPDFLLNSPWDLYDMALSEDGGNTWLLTPASGRSMEGQVFLDITFAPSQPSTVYASLGNGGCGATGSECELPTEGVLISDDSGYTWRFVNNDPLEGANVLVLAVHPDNHLVVYAGTAGQGLYVTRDGGERWHKLPGTQRSVHAIAFALDRPEFMLAGTEGGIFRSVNGGESWDWSSAGLDPEAKVNAVLFDPSDSSVAWAADFFSGVYTSSDGGASWQKHNDGLTTRAVQDLAITADGQTLYAATEGGGVFRLSSLDQDDLDALAQQAPPQPPPAVSTPGPSQPPDLDPTRAPGEIESPENESDGEGETAAASGEDGKDGSCPGSFALVAFGPMMVLLRGRRRSAKG